MFGRNQVSDKDLLKAVNQRLMRSSAIAKARVTASVMKGVVTVTGTLQYPIQRSPIMKAVQSVPGVGRIIDQMVLVERRANQPPTQARRPSPTEATADPTSEGQTPVAEAPIVEPTAE